MFALVQISRADLKDGFEPSSLTGDEGRLSICDSEDREDLTRNFLAWLGFLVEQSGEYHFEITTSNKIDRVNFLDMRLFIQDLDEFSSFLDSSSRLTFELGFEYDLVKYLFHKSDLYTISYRCVRGNVILSQGSVLSAELRQDCGAFAKQLYELGARYDPEVVSHGAFQEWYQKVVSRTNTT